MLELHDRPFHCFSNYFQSGKKLASLACKMKKNFFEEDIMCPVYLLD